MIDVDVHKQIAYEPPALVLVGSIVNIASELEKMGASLKPSVREAGEPVDWSNGRVS